MTLEKPLDVLKKGLSKVTQSLEFRKDELNAKLARKESIFHPRMNIGLTPKETSLMSSM
jgi:hypothetical protein